MISSDFAWETLLYSCVRTESGATIHDQLFAEDIQVEEDPDFTMRFKSHNIDGFLHKPFSIRQLNKMVKNHM